MPHTALPASVPLHSLAAAAPFDLGAAVSLVMAIGWVTGGVLIAWLLWPVPGAMVRYARRRAGRKALARTVTRIGGQQ